MNQYLSIGLGLVVLGVALWMLTDRVSSRIRNSRVWFVGWLGYLLLLTIAGRLLAPFFDRFPLSDEQFIPVVFGSVIVALIGVSVREYLRLRKRRS